MRILLAIVAIIGLLASPAAAAQSACAHGDRALGAMAIGSLPAMQHAGARAADPCCDPGRNGQIPKHDGKACLQACLAMTGVAAVLPRAPGLAVSPPVRFAPTPTNTVWLTPHDPPGFERPPRSIA